MAADSPDADSRPEPKRRRQRDWGDEPQQPRRQRREDDDDEVFYELDHRGGLILALGVVSLIVCNCCPFAGIGLGAAAYLMGNSDLAAMDAREMDPAGRSNTHAGKVCGIAGVILGVLGFMGFMMQIALMGLR